MSELNSVIDELKFAAPFALIAVSGDFNHGALKPAAHGVEVAVHSSTRGHLRSQILTVSACKIHHLVSRGQYLACLIISATRGGLNTVCGVRVPSVLPLMCGRPMGSTQRVA